MLLESQQPTQVLTPVGPPVEVAVADRPRVVIADDDPIAREVIVQMIESEESLELVGAASGVDEAIALTVRLRPDVVVLDWNMPGGGGPQATRRILGLRPGTQVIAFTSSSGPEAMVEMLRAGARNVLVKGCPAETLKSSIHRIRST